MSQFFTEDTKAVSLGLNATYNQSWNFDMAYTNFFGGRVFKGTDCQAGVTPPILPVPIVGGAVRDIVSSLTQGLAGPLCTAPAGPTAAPEGQSATYTSIANPSIDRDFVAASLSYSF